MPQPFFAVRKALAAAAASHLTAWEGLLRSASDRDELGRGVGDVVCKNLRADGMIGTPGMRVLLQKAIFDAAGAPISFTSSPAAVDAYVKACHAPAHQRLGNTATVPADTLWHVMTEEQLRESVNNSNYQPPLAHSAVWVDFRDACVSGRTNDAERLIRANGLALHPKGYQVFATFAEAGGPGGGNPDTWDATQACAALALSRDWPAYAPGQLLWMVKYRGLSSLDKVAVPTVADADWRSIFQPSRRRKGVTHGRALPLGPFWNHAPQMPEVVHDSAVVYPGAAPDGAPGACVLVGLPRFLGSRA